MEPIGTGRELALRMGARFPREDWIAALADRSGMSRESVEWHLQEDVEPPPEILAAAAEMLSSREGDGEEGLGGSFLAEDDLPLSGLPGNLGKLKRD
ncbi:hypothetical protein AB4099_32480 [Bosea sp. 2KB_26]|uniref:hypothetical protein n=1 Tax=Bosea sp. 2KB_26 TaxID=3237475 RepID=UPI003F8EA186